MLIRIERKKEIELFTWLREHFGLPAELPLGLSQDGEPEPVALAVTTILWSGYTVAEAVRRNSGATTSDVYVASLEQMRSDLANQDTIAKLTLAARNYADALLVALERSKELVISVAEQFPALVPEIHRRYSQGTNDSWRFFGALVAGQTSDLVFELMN